MALRDFWNRIWGKSAEPSGESEKDDGKPDVNAQIRVVEQPFAQVATNEQRLLNDDSIYAVFKIYKDILLGAGWTWEGKDAEKVKDWTDKLPLVPGWAQMLDSLAAVPFQRFSPIEVVWQTEGGWIPEMYRVLPINATSLHLDERQKVCEVHVTTTGGFQTLPMQNAVVHRYRPTFQYPEGQCIYDRLKEVIDYKRRCDAAIIMLVERYAGPAVVGYYPPGTTPAKQSEFLANLKKLQRASYGILPGPRGDKGVEIELIEPKNSGTMTFALDVLNMYERRIARAVLGSVLAVFESQYGTRAQSETHLKILTSVVEGYQEDVEDPINTQLVKPYLGYNVPGGDKLDVRWRLNAPDFSDLSKTGAWVDGLIAAGVLDAESEEDNNLIRSLFGINLRNWKKYPEVPIEERREQEQAANLPTGAGNPPKLPALKEQSQDAPKVA